MSTEAKITEDEWLMGFRHVVVHGCHSLDRDFVWAVVTEKLAILGDDVEAMLGMGGPG